jgi:pimeloyl-ACP methyl ester carboxylesterase
VARLVRADGCALYYEVAGDPRRPPIVLLEGLGGDIRGWRRNIPHLAAELFVVAFDHRGNGRSDAPDEPMTMRIFVDDTLALLDELRLERAHVYGQSFGGMVAQELVLAAPQRVRSLILACTHAGGARVAPVRRTVPKDKPWLSLYSERFAREHPEHVAEDLRVGSRNPQRPYAGRRQYEAMQGFDAYERLPHIAVPTLVMHGTEDAVIDVENARILAERIPNSELVLLEGAGHLYHSEQPDRVDGVVLDFVRAHRDV